MSEQSSEIASSGRGPRARKHSPDNFALLPGRLTIPIPTNQRAATRQLRVRTRPRELETNDGLAAAPRRAHQPITTSHLSPAPLPGDTSPITTRVGRRRREQTARPKPVIFETGHARRTIRGPAAGQGAQLSEQAHAALRRRPAHERRTIGSGPAPGRTQRACRAAARVIHERRDPAICGACCLIERAVDDLSLIIEHVLRAGVSALPIVAGGARTACTRSGTCSARRARHAAAVAHGATGTRAPAAAVSSAFTHRRAAAQPTRFGSGSAGVGKGSLKGAAKSGKPALAPAASPVAVVDRRERERFTAAGAGKQQRAESDDQPRASRDHGSLRSSSLACRRIDAVAPDSASSRSRGAACSL